MQEWTAAIKRNVVSHTSPPAPSRPLLLQHKHAHHSVLTKCFHVFATRAIILSLWTCLLFAFQSTKKNAPPHYVATHLRGGGERRDYLTSSVCLCVCLCVSVSRMLYTTHTDTITHTYTIHSKSLFVTSIKDYWYTLWKYIIELGVVWSSECKVL